MNGHIIETVIVLYNILESILFFSRLEIGPDSPQWVGAWWIGFLMAGVLALCVSVPVLAFPKQLPGNVPAIS